MLLGGPRVPRGDRGEFTGAIVVRALAIRYYSELEMLAIYLVVIAVLIARPAGLHGKSIE